MLRQRRSVLGSIASKSASSWSVSRSAGVGAAAGVEVFLVMPHDGAAWLKDIVWLEDFRGLISQCEA